MTNPPTETPDPVVNLEQLLGYLATRDDAAQRAWEAAVRSDPDDDVDTDETQRGLPLVFTLSRHPYDQEWECGYIYQSDKAEEWAVVAEGATPTAAVEALLGRIRPFIVAA